MRPRRPRQGDRAGRFQPSGSEPTLILLEYRSRLDAASGAPTREEPIRESCRPSLFVLLASTAWGLFASETRAQPSTVDPDPTTVDSVVSAFAHANDLPALSVAVGHGGRVRYATAVGLADVENGVEATPETRFRIASVTKPITATAVLALAERGTLDLDAPIQRYCPTYPEKRWPVTSRDLLSHLAGVPDYSRVDGGVWRIRTHAGWVEGSSPHHYASLAEAVEIFAADSLAAPPGSDHRYSNVGYLLLGCAIEGASGRSYEEALQAEILRPAGMERTRVDDAWAVIPDRARPYQMRTPENADWWWWTPAQKRVLRVGELYNARFEDTSLKRSAGGLLSTASDLVRFALALHADDLVGAETRSVMLTERKTGSGETTGWGMGWLVGERDGERVAEMTGGQPGASAILLTLPDAPFAVAAIANRDLVSLRPLADALARLWGRFPSDEP